MLRANALWLCSLAFVCLGEAAAQDYPNKPIRIIVSVPAGNGDTSARFIAPRISGPLRQPVVVENRGGAITGEILAKAQPDGYTLLLDATSLWIGPLLQAMPYDVIRDFAPITTTDRAPNLLAVNPSLPVTSVKELIALAKARPGELNMGTSSPGSLSHLAAELFKSTTGVNIVRIPYKGGALAVTAVISGEVQMVFNSVASLTPHTKSGKLRALGITSLQPSPLAPGVPTIAASGLPGFEATLIQGIFAPAKTPDVIVRRLNQEIVRALSAEDMKERYLAIGSEAVSSTPEEFSALIKSEMARWGKLIKDAGIRVE